MLRGVRGLLLLSAAGWALAGCGSAVEKPAGRPGGAGQVEVQPEARASANDTGNPVVARVNGEAIRREEVVSVLYRGRGRAVLDELVVTALVRQHARRKGVTSSRALLEAERRRIVGELAGDGDEGGDGAALLGYMLRKRGVSRAEYDLIVERQALLRAVAERDLAWARVGGAAEVAAEYERQHGRRVVVRLIVLTNLRQVDEALGRLSEGEGFGAVAGAMSQDEVSLSRGALLGPISAASTEVAAGLREAALAMEAVGQRSGPVHYRDESGAERWALLELEGVVAADGAELEAVRGQLLESIWQGKVSETMADVLERLQASAAVEVVDPVLR